MSDILYRCEDFENLNDETKLILNKVNSQQRHDFMNMLQIITGYMQIEWYDHALNSALEYGQRTESIGRLQKHGLTMTSQIIDHYIKIFSNHESKIEIINSLPPTGQCLAAEKKAAIKLLDELLERYSKEPIEKLVINFEFVEKIIVRLLIPDCSNVEFMDLILKYKNELPDLETGSMKNEIFWDYIEFGLFDQPYNGG